jgi:hypothetical protein
MCQSGALYIAKCKARLIALLAHTDIVSQCHTLQLIRDNDREISFTTLILGNSHNTPYSNKLVYFANNYESTQVTSFHYKGRVLALSANIRLGWT